MKKIILSLGIAMAVLSCNNEETVMPDNEDKFKNAPEQASVKPISQLNRNLNSNISVFNPIELGANDFIERGRYTLGFGNSVPIYVREFMLTAVGYSGSVVWDFRNGKWVAIGTTFNTSLGEESETNRWYMINGKPYFLVDDANLPDLRVYGISKTPTWFRVAPGRPMNTANLQRVNFLNGRVESSSVRNLRDFGFGNYIDAVKMAVLEGSTEENLNLFGIYITSPANFGLTPKKGYQAMQVRTSLVYSNPNVDITEANLYIDGALVRTDSTFPYHWGTRSEYPNELLGLNSGPHTFTVEAVEEGGGTSKSTVIVSVGN